MCVGACVSHYSLVGSSAGQGRDKTINVREQGKRSDCVRMIQNGNDMYRRHGSMARELQGPRKKYSIISSKQERPNRGERHTCGDVRFRRCRARDDTRYPGGGGSEERQLLRLLAANVAAWRCHRCSRQGEQGGSVQPAGVLNVD